MTAPITSPIFVTGASGFIGSQVVLDALQAGHRLRLSVRRESQIGELQQRFAAHASQLEFVVVADLGDSAALRAALADDVEYVIHIASPMPGGGDDFQIGYLRPAVQGTEAMLDAAEAAPAVKRLVIMSSLLALLPVGATRVPAYEIKAGSNLSIPVDKDMVFPPGPAGHGLKYCASKVLAHRATLEWRAAHQPRFTLVTVHPTFVGGRDMAQTDAAAPRGATAFLLNSLATPPPGGPVVPASLVDVRDVSLGVLRSLDLKVDVSSGAVTEALMPGEPTTWDAITDFVRAEYPQIEVKLQGPFDAPFTADGGRIQQELGIKKWRPMEEIVSSILDQQLELRAAAAAGGVH
ncbi:hypothetical protein B0T24DRAFT_707930 [Lasiosphaeria ovina]|uniref:NAD-dependent epimerase/dehydratase domain-containing protein n=1 Tax=Lasiosphaeria ovina TaxID=92902 RepID=A0AAE0N3H6_9PEZI|nr:hypothetical protein B0T24DRAFT_707930 [Lasiosphaeria ovina]